MSTRAHWQKSSFSGGGDGNNCVELTATPRTIHLRESDTPTTELTTSTSPLAYLLQGIKAGPLGTQTPRR